LKKRQTGQCAGEPIDFDISYYHTLLLSDFNAGRLHEKLAEPRYARRAGRNRSGNRSDQIERAILAGDQIIGKIASLRVDSPYSQA
jgi:hypothetical protein